jgi:hypothetical protein
VATGTKDLGGRPAPDHFVVHAIFLNPKDPKKYPPLKQGDEVFTTHDQNSPITVLQGRAAANVDNYKNAAGSLRYGCNEEIPH